MKIYTGNLGYDLTEDELKSAFESYGEVESAKIIVDRDTGRSKGFGFVEMPNNDQAVAAIDGLNGTELGGRTITVNESRPKPPRNNDRRGGRPSSGGDRRRSGYGSGGSRNRY